MTILWIDETNFKFIDQGTRRNHYGRMPAPELVRMRQTSKASGSMIPRVLYAVLLLSLTSSSTILPTDH